MNGPKKGRARLHAGIAFLALIVFGPLLYNLDAFIGQQRFEKLCRSEGGARVFQQLEADAGWLVEERIGESHLYKTPFWYGQVRFVRAQDKTGEWFDVVKDPDRDNKFILTPADRRRPVRYKLRFERLVFPDDQRFQRNQRQVIDLATGQVAASYTEFFYEWTKPERVILHAPTSQSCKLLTEDYRKFARALFAAP